MFFELLDSYQINPETKPLIKIQLNKLFKEYNKNSLEDQKKYKGEYQQIQTQIKNLKIRLGMGEIDKETYTLTFEHLNKKC